MNLNLKICDRLRRFATICDRLRPFEIACDGLQWFATICDFELRLTILLSPLSPPLSYHSSHHPQEVLLAQFSLYVHKFGLKLHIPLCNYNC